MKQTHKNLKDYCESAFGNNAYELLEAASHEIAQIASEFGVDWYATVSKVTLKTGAKDQVNSKSLKFSDKRLKGSSAVYASQRETRGGIRFPFVTFNSPKTGQSAKWSGYDYLVQQYQRENGLLSSERENELQKQRKQREQQRQLRIERLEQKERAEREAAKKEVEWYHQLLKNGKPYQGGNDYFIKKSIDALFERSFDDLVELDDSNSPWNVGGKYVAVPLQTTSGRIVGHQRLYEDGQKRQTKSLNSGDFKGAFYVLGNLETAKKIFAVEGFATGASVYLAQPGCAVIVCISAGNLIDVIRSIRETWTGLGQIVIAADNDWHKPKAGNTGLLYALETAREYNCRVQLPDVDEASAILGKPATDFNDIHCALGLDAVKKMLNSRSNRVFPGKRAFDWAKQRLQYSKVERLKDLAFSAAAIGLKLCPSQMRAADMLKEVRAVIPAIARFDTSELSKQVRTWCFAAMKEARSTRSFTREELAKSDVIYQKVEPVINAAGHPVLPESLVDEIKQLKGCVIIRSSMATAKTENIIKPLMHDAHGESRFRSCYLAHRISLVQQQAQDLSLTYEEGIERGVANTDVISYQDIAPGTLDMVEKMACCVNSIILPRFKDGDRCWFDNLSTLCIDEANQQLNHISQGTVESPVKVIEQLSSAIRTAGRVVLCDADANDDLLNHCRKARPDDPIYIFEMDLKCSDFEVYHSDKHSMFAKAVEWSKTERMIIADDSSNHAEELAQAIKEVSPEKRVLLITADEKTNQDVADFQQQPELKCQDWDVVIYSPAITSGVSIKKSHFTKHLGFFCGNTVTPAEAVQMLRRDRTARTLHIGLDYKYKPAETDRNEILRGMIAADDASHIEIIEENNAVVARRELTIYDHARLDALSRNSRSQSNFANYLLLIMAADGYNLFRIAEDEVEKKTGCALRADAKEVVKVQRDQLRMDETTPDDDEYKQLKRAEALSKVDKARMDRWLIENELCSEVAPETLEVLDNDAVKHIKRFELLIADEQKAIDYDRMQLDNKVVLTRNQYKRPVWQLQRSLFDGLGLDVQTGGGEFDRSAAAKWLADLVKNEGRLAMFNTLKVGSYLDKNNLPKCPVRFVTTIFKKIGLKLSMRKTSRTRFYSIDRCTWLTLCDFVEKRSARGIHSLDISGTFEDFAVSEKTEEKNQASQPVNGVALFTSRLYNNNKNVSVIDGLLVNSEIREAVSLQTSVTPISTPPSASSNDREDAQEIVCQPAQASSLSVLGILRAFKDRLPELAAGLFSADQIIDETARDTDCSPIDLVALVRDFQHFLLTATPAATEA